ncbi:MAG TPA: SMC-Scp complex subunit ScpB, partial [Kofleriaceae bacterium]|nr:SMC-Scp complex subunit ScpB [Kofleriaceae bacterium]
MSRKRGKHKKGAVEAIPADVLAEGSGPVERVAADAIATVDDVATTDDIATTEDVVTSDDVVAKPEVDGPDAPGDDHAPAADPEPAPRGKRGKRRGRRAAAESEAAIEAAIEAAPEAADDGDTGEPVRVGSDEAAGDAGAPTGEVHTSELNNAELAELIEPSDPAADRVEAAAGESGELGDGDGEAGDGEAGDGEDDVAVVFPTSAASMDSVQLKHLVEALIFASDKPLTVQRLRQLTRVGDVKRLGLALTELAEDYRERGVVLQQVSGGYQFRTRTQFSAWVQQLIAGRPVRLSRAQLETLAIIAYRQPITRPEIDDIRGVDSTATLKLLIDRMLIRALGKREEVGRPTLFGTTKEFL